MKRSIHLKRRTTLRKGSKKRAKELRAYSSMKAAQFKYCPFCEVIGCLQRAVDVHHRDGRNGSRLNDTKEWILVCRDHHRQIHDQPKWARENGLLK